MAITTQVGAERLTVRATYAHTACALELDVPDLSDAVMGSGGLAGLMEGALTVGLRAVLSARGSSELWTWRLEADSAVDRLARVIDTLRDDVTAVTSSDGTLGTAMRGVGQEIAQGLRAVLAQSADPAAAGSLVGAMDAVASRIDAAVETRLASAQQVAQNQQTVLVGMLATAVREIRQVDETTPLGARLTSLTNRVDELVTALAARDARAAERQAATAGGRDYEDVVAQHVATIAQCAGDTPERTGARPGVAMSSRGVSKKGDLVIQSVSQGSARVLFEAKAQVVSRTKGRDELQAGMTNRCAHAAVLVVPEMNDLTCGLPLVMLGPGMWVAVLDRERPQPQALRLAYAIARAYAVQAATRDVRPDSADLRVRVEEVAKLLSIVAELKTQIRNIGDSHGRAAATLARLELDLNASVDGIRQLIGGESAVRV